MIASLEDKRIFSLQFYGQSGCEIDRVKGKSTGFILNAAVVLFVPKLPYHEPLLCGASIHEWYQR
jgi:hypothetical protein